MTLALKNLRYVCTKFEADCSFRSKVIRGSRNFDIWSRDPGHAHFGVVLFSIRRRGASSVSVPNLKRIALFVQKLYIRGPEIMKLGHVTPATPIGVVLWSLRREAPSCMSVPNLKWIAFFVQKLLGGSKISPRRRRPSRGAGPPKFNHLEMVTTCTYRPSLVKIDA